MASLRNAFKSQKVHRERHQPQARERLGLLEKKKDYRQRARDYNEKKAAIKFLKQKALNRNPDEFRFHMVNSRVEDGEHLELEKEDTHTPEQIALMQTQDFKYVTFKRTLEMKKIEKLQNDHHIFPEVESGDAGGIPLRKHTFFVDSKQEAKKFNPAKRLRTHPSLLKRSFNRPTIDALMSGEFKIQGIDPEDPYQLLRCSKKNKKSFEELKKRVEREKQLSVVQRKLEIKRHLAKIKDGRDSKPEKVAPATADAAPVYKWKAERKR
ncbi:unnamed protein product [Cyprideis torosa]|uniref:U3 small nucleolar RNA-associated protein 11 n=1 Tax=Cyprideis torosa TaxID=163714 RepID=A0A7R8ZPI0_9CRUS|nr:unnamed protein product [Cyprideis torosa]CAG0900607.1 unnamed protein product [Cyprideis torosa]